MRALILGSDFVKLPNGDIKVLEVNTNTGVLTKGVQYLDFSPIEQLITSNSFTEVHLIFNDRNFLSPHEIYKNPSSNSFYNKIKQICTNLNVSFNEHIVETYAVTVPFIEDSEDKLIIRLAYDTTAVIDSEYTADKAGFLKLLNNKEYVPKHYTVETDTLETEEFSYTGSEPNYIVKSRINMDDRTVYPKLYKINNQTELTALKNSIDTNSYLIQEYIVSEEINNKLGIIRSIDLLYGSNLDILHLGSYKILNVFENDGNNTLEADGTIIKADRPKFITYTQKREAIYSYIIDEDTDVWMADGTKKPATELIVGDTIKTIKIPELPINEGLYSTDIWSGSVSDFVTNYTIESTTVQAIELANEDRLFLKISTNSGKIWHDLPATDILIKDGDIIRFRRLEDINIGDTIYLLNTETGELLEDTIIDKKIEWKTITIGTLDVEPSDLFLPFIDDGTFTLIQHNLCKAFCKQYKPCPNYNSPNCNQCSIAQCGGSK